MSGGSDKTTSTSGPPEWAVPYIKDYYGTAKNTANLPYQPYGGQQVGDMNPYTQSGLNATAQRALQGSQEVGQARTQLGNTLNGMYMGYQTPQNQNAGQYNQNASAYNPNAGVFNGMAGAQNSNANAYNQSAGAQNANANAFNQFAGVQNAAAGASGGDGGYNQNANLSNKFAGSNPYLGGMIDASSQDVLRNYNTSAKPQLESAMARSGSFGNSGLEEMQRNQQSDLQKNLGNLSNQYRFQDYTTQQGLDEAKLGRMYGAGQQQVQNRYQAGENSANRQFSAGESLANRLFGAGQQLAGQQFQAGRDVQSNLYGAGSQLAGNQFQAGRDLQGQLYGAGQQQAQNVYGAGQSLASQLFGAGSQQAQNLYSSGENLAGRQDSNYNNERARQIQGISLAPQLANQDYIDSAALTGAGDRFGAQNQALLDAQYGNFREARDYPYQQLRTLGSAFGANPGSSSTTTAPGTSTGANVLGTAASLYGLNSMSGGGK